jgi:hypothetical protein
MPEPKPILRRLKVLAIVLGFAAAGVLFGALLAQTTLLDRVIPEPTAFNGWMALLLLAGLFTALAVHEMGHLLTGLVLGFRFELLVVGFLGIRRNEVGGIRVYWNRDWGMFGGVASTAPRPDSVKVPEKMALILLAGPLASLLWTACCWGFMPLFPRFWAFGLLVSGLVSLALFMATTLPERTGVFYTDRKRFQRLTARGKARDIEMALLEVLRHEQLGLPIQALGREKLLKICEDDAPMFRYFGFFLLRAYDQDHPEKRSQWEEQLAALKPEIPPSLAAMMDKAWDRQAVQRRT